jgi:hypothetical protein
MAPNKKGAQKPKANAAEEVEETFQAVVCQANYAAFALDPLCRYRRRLTHS